MRAVMVVRDTIVAINTQAPPSGPEDRRSEPARERDHINQMYDQALKAFQGYIQTHSELQRNILDPDGGDYERAQMATMTKEFQVLAAAIETTKQPRIDNTTLLNDPGVRLAQQKLLQQATDLHAHLYEDVRASFERSKADHRRSLYITGSATALALVLILTLLFYFRVWVFQPIKELQAGVVRVHSGNFDQPIKLASQDELEELANEFNAMTVRLRDIYKSLAQQVNERTRQLVRSERMVSVGFLAAGVAHEINNPLASIAFCSEALERRLRDVMIKNPTDAETVSKYLKMIQDEAQRCKQITEKLLNFSRTGGRREPTELSGLVADVLEVAKHLPNVRGKTITFHPEGEVTALVSGPDIKSVVLNMVVNALDSMDDGGRLQVALVTRGEFAEMVFTDTGCGMTSEVLEHIFEPFFTRNRTGNGTGLGLSISHQIIDQHGGTISVTSPGPGQGSTFLVRFPLMQKDTRIDSGSTATPAPHRATAMRSQAA
jgi:two-component system, NtrC family, sensor kinase